jgi:hypothetical protein
MVTVLVMGLDLKRDGVEYLLRRFVNASSLQRSLSRRFG